MPESYSIYCDESCHLENDGFNTMVLGAVWCRRDKVSEISNRLKEIRVKHGLSPYAELKWIKISPAKEQFYLGIIDYFFDDDHLHFRGIIIPDKSILRHEEFGQTHDEWYYKMFFDLLKVIIAPDSFYDIYLDYKDTWGSKRVKKLHEVLSNNNYDFSQEIIRSVKLVRSDQVQLIQLCDLLIGAICYKNRGLTYSKTKLAIIKRIQDRTGYTLEKTTLLRERKMNLLRWNGREL